MAQPTNKVESSDPYVIITRKQESIASLRAELAQREADLRAPIAMNQVLSVVAALLFFGVLTIIFIPEITHLIER
jgi:hypothetical protein